MSFSWAELPRKKEGADSLAAMSVTGLSCSPLRTMTDLVEGKDAEEIDKLVDLKDSSSA